ncbi:hypothetical protein JCM10212_001355 [Sporobolomyces blumeae]
MPPLAALLLVDIQNDFLPPSGALAVSDGDEILPNVYRLLEVDESRFHLVVASQDHHPERHVSFASAHPPHEPFETITVRHPVSKEDKSQELWPDHCVQGTEGCEFEKGIKERLERWREVNKFKVVRKGEDVNLDAYSAFAKPLQVQVRESQGEAATSPLTQILLDAKIDRVLVVGIATDFCVRQTVLSALSESRANDSAWQIVVIKEGVRGVYAEKEDETLRELEREGARVVGIDDEDVMGWLWQ